MKTQLLTCITLIFAITINAQVTLLKEINDSGSLSSSPNNLFVYNNSVFFGADDSSGSNSPGNVDLGRELWVTDGTGAGTSIVKDLSTGNGNSSPGNFFELGGTMYFSANSGAGNVLFSSDGTESGTTSTGGSFVFNPEELGGIIYYINTLDSNGLYTFDGTTQAKAVNAGGDDVQFIGGVFTNFNNKILGYGETATEEPTIGRELYEYDTTTDTYSLIKDIDTGTGDSSISNFTVIGSALFFEADNALWKTDGTGAGTVAVTAASTITFLANFYTWNGKLYFEGDTGTSGDQLWVYDPIGDTLTNLSTIDGEADHNPSDFAIYNGYLYYSGADASDTDKHLFRTDGSTIEQLDSSIKDIDEIVVLNGILYFEGDNGATGNELYRADPTTLSTNDNKLEIVSIYPNPASDYIMISKNLINASYTIHDITGKTVKEGNIISARIDINLNSGLYLFKVKTNLSTITKKILVK